MSERLDSGDSGRWQKLNQIFAAALEVEPSRQSAFLQDACHGDEDLRREAEAILRASQHADERGFLKADVFEDAARVLGAGETPDGAVIGQFRVVNEIGRGGMGAVYLASREGFQQQVALKIIKRGMDTDAIVQRFLQERDVLASLNHPNIARLFDGGTAAGLPFIAMEYVEGRTITAYCDEHRLAIDDRLILFRKVCGAVSYAHRHLVVHRDIKPSNILIGPDGEPKLLDFGIAKLLAPNSDNPIETVTGVQLLTPEYASPEQIRGEKITTASDIYSLGVLLYELLCGRRPFQFEEGVANEMLQVISQRQPAAPSTASQSKGGGLKDPTKAQQVALMRSEKPGRLQRRLSGDLDNIVLMALRKEPERRYHSVQQLSEDLRRHLSGLPVTARPATLSYRVGKFIERNRTATVFATVALIAILTGLSISVWQAVVAKRQSARAERRSNEVRRLTNTLLKDIENQVGVLPGSDPTRRKLYEISIEYLDGLARETNDPAVLKQLSEAYVLLGKQYGYEAASPEKSRASISRGLEISRQLVRENPNDLEAKKLLAVNLEQFDFFCEKEPSEKLKLTAERTRLREELVAAYPADGETYSELVTAYRTFKYLYGLYEKPDEARNYSRLIEQTVEREVQVLDKPSATTRERDLLAEAYMDLGSIRMEELNDQTRAEDYYRRALAVADKLVAEHPDYRFGWVRVAAANREIGDAEYNRGDYKGALDHFQSSLRTLKEASIQLTDGQMLTAEPGYMLRIAKCFYLTGQHDEAIRMLREAESLNQHIGDFGQTAAQTAIRNARFLVSMADVYVVFGSRKQAMRAYAESETLWQKVAGIEPQKQVEAETQTARLCLLRGNLASSKPSDPRDAREQYSRAVNILSKLKADNQAGIGELKDLREAQQKLIELKGH